jgi:hypothetical protein
VPIYSLGSLGCLGANRICRRISTAQNGTRPRNRGQGHAAAWWPLSSCCQGCGTFVMSAPTLSVSAIVLSMSKGACWKSPVQPPRHLAQVAGRGLLVREVSPTGAPRPSCCCAPLGALFIKGKQIGPGRQSDPLRLGTVTAGCPPGAALLAAQRRVARARWACGLALDSPSDRSRRVRSLAPRLGTGLCVHPQTAAPGGSALRFLRQSFLTVL